VDVWGAEDPEPEVAAAEATGFRTGAIEGILTATAMGRPARIFAAARATAGECCATDGFSGPCTAAQAARGGLGRGERRTTAATGRRDTVRAEGPEPISVS